MNLTVRPLTPDLWPQLEELFGRVGACNGCWCMYWRIGGAYNQRPREKNKAAFKAVVKKVLLLVCSPSKATRLSAGRN